MTRTLTTGLDRANLDQETELHPNTGTIHPVQPKKIDTPEELFPTV
jgi:hypothetical protein